mgnify:CR=1 FL=1
MTVDAGRIDLDASGLDLGRSGRLGHRGGLIELILIEDPDFPLSGGVLIDLALDALRRSPNTWALWNPLTVPVRDRPEFREAIRALGLEYLM